MELSEIRNEIDKLDKQIQNLFEERMLLCQDVARYKKPVPGRSTSPASRCWTAAQPVNM